MRKLKFLNPVNLRSEVFSTARLGEKWGERTVPEEDGQRVTVELVDGNDKSLGTAVIIGSWTGHLSALPALVIETCHDPVCRTWSGVAQTLNGLYPEETITYDTVVTILQLTYAGSAVKSARPDLLLPS